MEIRVEITGIEEALRTLDNAVRPEALRAGLHAAAFFVEGQAKLKAPVDTGFLRNSIQVGEVTAVQAIVAVGAEYGLYQEMGTRFMPAHPYLRPALEGNRERIAQIIRDAIQRRAGR
jgi:HK97 gp10 family phage protein